MIDIKHGIHKYYCMLLILLNKFLTRDRPLLEWAGELIFNDVYFQIIKGGAFSQVKEHAMKITKDDALIENEHF
jgi:hypothetical protein